MVCLVLEYCIGADFTAAFLGDTVHATAQKVEALASFDRSPTMVYAGFYPQDNLDFPKLDEALQRVSLLLGSRATI